MYTYYYALVIGGYRWNILQRVTNAIGLEPIGLGDSGNVSTFLTFSRELTTSEQNTVQSIMNDNPSYPPTTTNTIAFITDIWNERAAFQAAIGLVYDIYYDESVRGSGNVNQIKLVFRKTLTNTEKNKVKAEFAKLIGI